MSLLLKKRTKDKKVQTKHSQEFELEATYLQMKSGCNPELDSVPSAVLLSPSSLNLIGGRTSHGPLIKLAITVLL